MLIQGRTEIDADMTQTTQNDTDGHRKTQGHRRPRKLWVKKIAFAGKEGRRFDYKQKQVGQSAAAKSNNKTQR